MKHLVKITSPKHPLSGQILPGELIYHDVRHVENQPDLFRVQSSDGVVHLLSNQIDESHFLEQLHAERVAELGANIGDMVMITKSGGGAFCAGFDLNKPHIITGIGNSVNVHFDHWPNNGASIFRPKVQLIQ